MPILYNSLRQWESQAEVTDKATVSLALLLR